MLDDDERVTRLLQSLHHTDHPTHIARMQADGRLIEHEQRVDQRSAERRGQIDTLNFAARQCARLAIEREIAQPDIHQKAQAAAHFAQHQIGSLIEGTA